MSSPLAARRDARRRTRTCGPPARGSRGRSRAGGMHGSGAARRRRSQRAASSGETARGITARSIGAAAASKTSSSRRSRSSPQPASSSRKKNVHRLDRVVERACAPGPAKRSCGAPPACGGERGQDRAAARRAVEVEAGRRRAVVPSSLDHGLAERGRDRAPTRSSTRTAPSRASSAARRVCSSSPGAANGTTSAGTPRAQQVERGVVAALADRHASRPRARRRGRAPPRTSVDAGARHSRQLAQSASGRNGPATSRRQATVEQPLRSRGRAQQRPAEAAAARRDDDRARCAGARRGAAASRDDEAGVVDGHAQRRARAERLLEPHEARVGVHEDRRRRARSRSAHARSSCAAWSLRPRTRMSRRLADDERPRPRAPLRSGAARARPRASCGRTGRARRRRPPGGGGGTSSRTTASRRTSARLDADRSVAAHEPAVGERERRQPDDLDAAGGSSSCSGSSPPRGR